MEATALNHLSFTFILQARYFPRHCLSTIISNITVIGGDTDIRIGSPPLCILIILPGGGPTLRGVALW